MPGRPFRKRLKYSAIYWTLRLAIFSSHLVPRTWWLGFFGWIGGIVFRFQSRYKDLVIFHLGMAFGRERSSREIVALAREVYVMLGKNGAEILRSFRVDTIQDLEKFVTTTGLEHAEKAKAKGKGVIYFTGHLGAFELMIRTMSLYGYPMAVIGTALKDDRINEVVVGFRGAHGSEPIERGKETFKLIKTLKSGGGVAMLIDQDTKVKSVFVNFFGMPASTPAGAALMALKTGAAVVPVVIHLGEDKRQHVEVLPEVEVLQTGDEEKDIISNTQLFTDVLEAHIRKYPAQWVWMHERWKTRPGETVNSEQ